MLYKKITRLTKGNIMNYKIMLMSMSLLLGGSVQAMDRGTAKDDKTLTLRMNLYPWARSSQRPGVWTRKIPQGLSDSDGNPFITPADIVRIMQLGLHRYVDETSVGANKDLLPEEKPKSDDRLKLMMNLYPWVPSNEPGVWTRKIPQGLHDSNGNPSFTPADIARIIELGLDRQEDKDSANGQWS